MAYGTRVWAEGGGTGDLILQREEPPAAGRTSFLGRWRNHLSPEHEYNAAIGGHNSQRRHNSVAAPRVMAGLLWSNSVLTASSACHDLSMFVYTNSLQSAVSSHTDQPFLLTTSLFTVDQASIFATGYVLWIPSERYRVRISIVPHDECDAL
jgi:hypothetical protein